MSSAFGGKLPFGVAHFTRGQLIMRHGNAVQVKSARPTIRLSTAFAGKFLP